MLSPFEIRPWVQAALLVRAAHRLCYCDRRHARASSLGIVLLALLPATVAILGFGERPWQAVNPRDAGIA